MTDLTDLPAEPDPIIAYHALDPEPSAAPPAEARVETPVAAPEPPRRSHLDAEPGDHRIPERIPIPNTDLYELTGNTLYFDAGGNRLA